LKLPITIEMTSQPQTEEISKTIAQLRFETIRESLKFAKCKSQGAKPVLVKNYEGAVLDVGIEKFVSRLPDDVVATTAKLLNVEPGANQSLKDGLTENIQAAGLSTVLGKSEEDLLKKFSSALGLEDETPEYAKKIEDEVMLIGMEGFLQNLNPELLRKHCVELNLTKSGSKNDLVERLMVHIFELEPLDTKKETTPAPDKTTDKEKEEAKPKENKKRKAPEPKEKKAGKKAKAVTGDDQVEATTAQRPKRSATKKKIDDEVDEKPSKRQKKEPTPKKEKPSPKEKKEKTAAKKEKGTRTPYVAPPLSTIVKGQYTAADLHNKFNLTDLQKYSKQEGLKSSGQKKHLIKRIIAYLETGKKDEPQDSKKSSKTKSTKAKSGVGKKKPATKEDKEKVAVAESKPGEDAQA